ncbi:MAG: hypothetical protein HQL71_00590 [Magnetococcales bacterium]|nr:hypothetical protein [Magnetococcales bacterium]
MNSPKKHPSIIALAPHAWWNHWLSRQQLLSRMGQRGWPVVYSFGPVNFWERHTKPWSESPWFGRFVERDNVLVDYPARLAPHWPRFPNWDRWVSRRHALGLKKAISNRGNGELVVMLFHPIYEPWLGWLQPDYVVYHVFDAYNMMENWQGELAEREMALINRADLITTSSKGILANLPGQGPTKGRVLNNGADSIAFKNGIGLPCPDDLKKVPHPRIGYVGAINGKIDFAMLLEVSKREPDWHWVFLGPIYLNGNDKAIKVARSQWNQLLELDNIHYFGRKPGEQMPSYVNNMDILTICYKVTIANKGEEQNWVVHGYPTKLHEFLATGLPVVAGPQQVIVEDFSHVVQIADSVDSWQKAIIDGLKNGGVGTKALRQEVALQNTWDKRVDLLEGWFDEMIGVNGK